MDRRAALKLEVMPEQRELMRQAIANESRLLKLSLEQLEARVAPIGIGTLFQDDSAATDASWMACP